MLFKIYADFKWNGKRVRGSDRYHNTSYAEKYQKHISCSFAYYIVCGNDKFTKPVVPYREKMQSTLKQFFKSMIIAK